MKGKINIEIDYDKFTRDQQWDGACLEQYTNMMPTGIQNVTSSTIWTAYKANLKNFTH